jgi:hypothetical protein
MTVLAKTSSKLTELPTEMGLSWLRVTNMRSKKLVTEAGEISGSKRKGNMRRWKPLLSNG